MNLCNGEETSTTTKESRVASFSELLLFVSESPEFMSTQGQAALIIKINIAKGKTDPRVEFISQVQTKILIKVQFWNLD